MKPKLNAIGLVVADLAASKAFYSRLGLEFDDDTGDGHVECPLTPGMKLMLDTEASHQSIMPAWTKPTGGPRAALAFQFDSPAEVDTMFEDLTKAGYQSLHEPWDAFWGHRYATVLDPDGNGVDLYAVR